MRDYEKILKDLLKHHFRLNHNGEVGWAYLPNYTLQDFDEELNDRLFEIMKEMGCE